MIEIRKKSALPFYAVAAVWIIYCVFFPLYKASHFIILICLSIAIYAVLAKVIPDTVSYIEKEPEKTGDPELDALLEEGRDAVSKMRAMAEDPLLSPVADKVNKLVDLTRKIFENLADNRSNYQQVKQFSGYFLPSTFKLLTSYRHMREQNISGENIDSTMDRIEDILSVLISAYTKQLDALFAGSALDIETDITVLESMMKSQGLTDSDFDI